VPADYASYREFLVDLRIVCNLYRERSEVVFHTDRWLRSERSTHPAGGSLTERIGTTWRQIHSRLERTEQGRLFPAVRLMRDYALEEVELVIVVFLMFRELFEGNAYTDVSELCRLVSCSEEDLLHSRRLVADDSALIKGGILAIEPMLEGRVLTGEAYLSDWALKYMFGVAQPGRDIRPDERIDWHMYLAKLEDTKGFYRELDAN
jgi:hypothetical protein